MHFRQFLVATHIIIFKELLGENTNLICHLLFNLFSGEIHGYRNSSYFVPCRENPDFSHLLTLYCLQYLWGFYLFVCFTYVLFTKFQYCMYSIIYKFKDCCHLVNEQQPEYCVAAKTDRNGRMIKEIRDCKTKLPALCSGSEVVDTEPSSIHGEFSSVWSRCCYLKNI